MKYTIFALFFVVALCAEIKENESNDLVEDLRCAGKSKKNKTLFFS